MEVNNNCSTAENSLEKRCLDDAEHRQNIGRAGRKPGGSRAEAGRKRCGSGAEAVQGRRVNAWRIDSFSIVPAGHSLRGEWG